MEAPLAAKGLPAVGGKVPQALGPLPLPRPPFHGTALPLLQEKAGARLPAQTPSRAQHCPARAWFHLRAKVCSPNPS